MRETLTSDFDLWEDDDETFQFEEPAPAPKKVEAPAPEIKEEAAPRGPVPAMRKKGLVRITDGHIEVYSKVDLHSHPGISNDLKALYGLEEELIEGVHLYRTQFGAINAFIFRHILRLLSVEVDPKDGKMLKEAADRLWNPTATVADTGKHILIKCPNVKVYTDMLKKVGAYPAKDGFRVNISRVIDLESMNNMVETTLPRIEYDDSVLRLTREPILGFDGTLESLKTIPIGMLNIISADLQMWKQKKDGKTLEEKFTAYGIETLHDLLFYLPKRFIDKSNPQEIEGLMEGESVTIVGKIASCGLLPNNMGVNFTVENGRGRTIRTSFWRQHWLKNKFREGDEVLITGKVNRFKGRIELGGASIEHADEAALLPIVPVYKQSETKGVTTALIMAACREFLSRVGEIKLPPYLRGSKNMDYTQALTELHFPTSLENFQKACNFLAYYELVYMQLIMLEEKTKVEAKKGIAQHKGPRNLQNMLAKSLPFKLTNSQIQGIKKIDSLLGEDAPSQILLNADVGAGKSLCAQLSCLRSIEAGYQAVIIGPTEILARQLFETTSHVMGLLKENTGEEVRVAYLGSGMKVKEKKPILAAVAAGEVDILVGTTAVIAASVKYANLGLIVIDEQQKFGAEQRSRLLASRDDGLVPDLLMMSATPIPRSTAQVFYGDMQMVELTEKPPGRLPIKTEWIEEDPIDFAHQIANRVWSDVQKEAEKGNQTFVITPMVVDSDKVDAASVERTYESLSKTTLRGLRVGFVHGRLKKDEQQDVMDKFKNKELDVLVASTVVEVGVDIKDATRVVILSADRMGASSLHQIRGRAGRNSKPSKCYLVSLGKTESSQKRLQSLVDSENGFDIALADLDVRGEGNVFGTDQSGSSEMMFASLARHKDWITQARSDAEKILLSQYREMALNDAADRFNSTERLF